jgi:hypothetical protein
MLNVLLVTQLKITLTVSSVMPNVSLARLTVVIALDVLLVNLRRKVNVLISVHQIIIKMITFVNFVSASYVKHVQANMMGANL